jgi:hypothetical protein
LLEVMFVNMMIKQGQIRYFETSALLASCSIDDGLNNEGSMLGARLLFSNPLVRRLHVESYAVIHKRESDGPVQPRLVQRPRVQAHKHRPLQKDLVRDWIPTHRCEYRQTVLKQDEKRWSDES